MSKNGAVDERRTPWTTIKNNVKHNAGTVIGVLNKYPTVVKQYRGDRMRMYGVLTVFTSILGCYGCTRDADFIALNYWQREPALMDSALVVVGLDETYLDVHSSARITRKDSLAYLIERALKAGARVVALDYIVKEEDPGFEILDSIVAHPHNLVFPVRRELKIDWTQEGRNFVFPIVDDLPESFKGKVWSGYSNIDTSFVWQMQAMAHRDHTHAADPVPSFALAVLAAWYTPDMKAERHSSVKWQAVIDSISYPTQATDRVPIDYFDILDPRKMIRAQDMAMFSSKLRDKIVLFGAAENIPAAGDDVHRTPYGRAKGVLVQAAIINNLLRGAYIRRLGSMGSLVIVLSFFFAAVWIVWKSNGRSTQGMEDIRRRVWSPFSFIVVLWIAYFAACIGIFKYAGWLLPAHPALITALWGTLTGLVALDFREAHALERSHAFQATGATDIPSDE